MSSISSVSIGELSLALCFGFQVLCTTVIMNDPRGEAGQVARSVIAAIISILIFGILILGNTVGLVAQWSMDPTRNTVINDDPGSQRNPYVVSDMAGGAVVVWEDDTYEHGLDLYAQRIDHRGFFLWNPDGIPICTAPNPQVIEDVISDGSGGAIILWKDYRDATYGMDPPNYLENALYAQRIDSSGTVLWEKNGMVVRSLVRDFIFVYDGCLTTDGAGGAMIVWGDNRERQFDIYSQHITEGGQILWEENGIKVNWQGKVYDAGSMIISDNENGAILHFENTLQRISTDGKFPWSKNGLDCGYGIMASDRIGGAIVSTITHAQRYNGDGTTQWGDGVDFNHAIGRVYFADMTSDGIGGIIWSWTDDRTGEIRPYSQRIDIAGIVQWQENGIPYGGAPVVSDGEGGVIFQYSDSESENFDSFLQKIDIHGTPKWGETGTLFRYREKLTPGWSPFRMTDDCNGGAIIVWEEQNLSTLSWDVLGQRINRIGQLGDIVSSAEETSSHHLPKEIRLLQSYPNPFNASTIIPFSLPESGYVELRVYNIFGQEVRTLVNSNYPPGTYSILWDGKDNKGKEVTSGIYIYQLTVNDSPKSRKMVLMK